MDYFVALRLKFIDFFKRNKRKVFIVLIIWLIIFIINTILKYKSKPLPVPSTTYTPHVSVLDNTKEVPKKYQKPIENLIDTYMNYCNNKEYEKAYNLITDDCKKNVYPTLEQFQGYIDEVFEGKKKIYNIQSYSIVDNKYIYNIRILDDILANGTTDGYYYYEEKFALIEQNGEIKLSIGDFIESKTPNTVVEDDNMSIEITNVSVDYEKETYSVKVTNKTDKYIVFADNTQTDEILLDLGDQTRRPNNMQLAYFFVLPNATREYNISFDKFYDNGKTSQKLIFNSIRILNNYNWKTGTTEEDLNNAVKLYSLAIDLNQ